MKAFTATCFVLALLCLAMSSVSEYQWGYYGRPYVPDGLITALSWFFLVSALITAWFVALFLRAARLWVTGLLIGSILPFLILPSLPLKKEDGLRDCVMKNHTPEDIRKLAQEIERSWDLHDGSMLPSRDEMNETQRHLYDQLAARYPFLHRGTNTPDPRIFHSDDNTLNFMWGGGFGHWGFCVGVDGHKVGFSTENTGKVVCVSDDIYFYSGE